MTGVPAGQRLDGDEPERLRPRAGHQRGVALGEQLVAIGLVELAEVLDDRTAAFSAGLEDLVEVVALACRRADLGRDPQGTPGAPGDLDRLDDALLRDDPADEAQRVRRAVLERRLGQAQAVVDDRRPTGRRGG